MVFCYGRLSHINTGFPAFDAFKSQGKVLCFLYLFVSPSCAFMIICLPVNICSQERPVVVSSMKWWGLKKVKELRFWLKYFLMVVCQASSPSSHTEIT